MEKKILSLVITNIIGLSSAAADEFTDFSYLASNETGITADEESINSSDLTGSSSATSADDFTDFLRQTNSEQGRTDDDGVIISGHVGSSIEYESKTTDDWGNGDIKEKITTNEIGNIFVNWHNIGLRLNYSLKTMTREQRNDSGYYENEDSLKHLLLLDRPFALGNGWGTGLGYETEYITSKVVSPTADHHKKNSLEQIFRSYLTYWNNNYNVGFYGMVEYLILEFDNGSWGTRDEKGYSAMIKPYTNYGNFQFELELFYQAKNDNESAAENGHIFQIDDFMEKYIQPTIRYSIDNGGLVFLTTRFAKNETITKGSRPDYFKDVIKTSIGYETDIDDWMVKAEYEYTREKETTNDPALAGKEKRVDNHKFYAHALYRF